MAGEVTETGSVHCANLFDQLLRLIAIDLDLGAKRS